MLLNLFDDGLKIDSNLNKKKLANTLINDLLRVLNNAKMDMAEW